MLKYILLGIVAFTGYYAWTIFPVHHGPGVTASAEPTVERITWEKPFSFKGSTIVPLKKISAQVRIIKKRRYYFDKKARLAPVDVLVGWQELSDERNLDHVHFSLKDRNMNISYSSPPLPLNDIYAQTDLWHLVPSSEEISDKVKSLRNGHIISVEGFIVNVESSTNFDWESEIASRNTSPKITNTIIWVNKINLQ